MVNKCPIKSSEEWKNLVKHFGEDGAWLLYIKAGEDIPPLSDVSRLMNRDNLPDQNESERVINSLRKKIEEVLSKAGISIGILNEFDNRLGIKNNKINGIFDPINYKKNTQGLIELIKVIQGKEGDYALPEEFSHVAIASVKNTPLYDRLLNILNENDLNNIFESDEIGSFEKYNTLYNNNLSKMKEEALGKLLAKHLIKNESIPQTNYKSLLNRLITAIKNIFSKVKVNEIESQLSELDREINKLAVGLLNGSINIDLNNILNNEDNTKLYSIKEKLERNRAIHKRLIDTEQKRLKIFEVNKKPSEELKNIISERDVKLAELEMMYADDNYDQGISKAMINISDDLLELKKKLGEISSSIGTSILPSNFNITSGVLRDIKSYIDGYSPIIKDIIRYYDELKDSNSDRFSIQNESLANEINKILINLENNYEKNSRKLFINFLKPYFGDKEVLEIPFGKEIKSYTLEQLIDEAETDIGTIDRFLDSMSDSSDMLLRLIDQPVKEQRFKQRQDVLETSKILKNAQIKLEKAGIKDTSFIYKKNDKGELTGYLIQEVDWVKYNRARKNKIEELNNKYGERYKTDRQNSIAWTAEYNIWLNNNNTKHEDNTFTPKVSLYEDQQFKSMNEAQREFYNTIVSIKTELDSYLPDYKVSNYLAPQIRKDHIERLKDSKSFKEAKNNLIEWWNEKWLVKEDETQFGNSRGIADFNDREVMSLPIFYTSKLKNINDLSTDIVSSMILYSDMAYSYKHMNDIINMMEIGRDIIRNREVGAEKSGKPLMERFTRKGRVVTNKILKSQGDNKIEQKLNDFYEAQIYGRYSEDSGSWFGKISKDKTADNINMITSMSTIALSPLTAVANVMTGKVMMRIEAIAGEFFNYKDLAWADKTYMQHVPGFLADLNRREIKSKIGLFNEKFNVSQDYEKELRDVEMNQKNFFIKNFKTSSLFFMMKGGENYMQTRTALSLAHNTKLKLNGKDINLWDAYEVKTDDKGISRLLLKEGVTKQDGSLFTSKDELAFTNKSKAINQRMHGIYNKEDRSAIQRVWWGRMAIMFRKWMIPSINRRFQKSAYNYDLSAYTEGYYNTAWQFIYNSVKELKEGKLNMISQWNNLNTTQKANLKRALTEIANFAVILLSSILLGKLWDDDKEENWIKNFALYQINRQITEIGVFVPTGVTQVTEGLKLLKSPMAGVKVIDDIMDLFNATTWFDEIQRGRYKGSYKITKDILDLVPMNNTIWKATHPEDALAFYNMF